MGEQSTFKEAIAPPRGKYITVIGDSDREKEIKRNKKAINDPECFLTKLNIDTSLYRLYCNLARCRQWTNIIIPIMISIITSHK